MRIKFDKNELKNIIIDFYNFTDIPITIFDPDFNSIVAHPDFLSPYCARIRENGDRHLRCLESDIDACKTACARKNSFSYVCHAGVNETVTPVYYENIIAGYILFGQYTKSQNSLESLKNYVSKYDLDYDEMTEHYLKLKSLSDNQINSAINILKICITKIWLDELIKFEDNLLITSIGIFIGNNLNLPLTVDFLCKKFLTNKKHLYALFKEHFNMPVKEFILNKKIELALHLLKTTKKSLTDICALAGFFDYNNFIQRFKKQTGTTPYQYRLKTNAEHSI